MKKTVLLFVSILPFFLVAQEWLVRTIGTCPKDKAYSVSIGDARNDGVNRVYVTTRGEQTDGSIYEFSYFGNSWSQTSVVSTSLKNLVTIDIGNGRNDHVNRIYAAEWGGNTSRVLEYTWNGSNWTQSIIETPAKGMLSCEVNDARGDGIKRVYVAGWIIHREYTWNGTAWTSVDISTTVGSEGPVAIGKGRNDNIVRYYAPGNRVKEFSWNGNVYNLTDSISAPNGASETVVLGDFRNDQIIRLLTEDNFGMWEYTFNTTAWSQKKIGSRTGRAFLFAGVTKSDGKTYVYSTDIGLPFMELSYNSSTQAYDSANVDAVSGATALMDIGVGRNDDTVRIYIPNYATGLVYEVTNVNPYVYQHTEISTINVSTISVYNDSFGKYFQINCSSIGLITIELYDLNGRLILSKKSNGQQMKMNYEGLPSGIYLLKVRCNNKIHTEKVFVGK